VVAIASFGRVSSVTCRETLLYRNKLVVMQYSNSPPSRSMMSQIQPRLLLWTSNPTNKIQMFPQLSIILVLLFRHFRASAWTTRFSAVFTTKLFDVCCAAEQVIFMAKMYDIPVTAVSLCSRFCQRAYAFLYSFCYNFVSLNLVSF